MTRTTPEGASDADQTGAPPPLVTQTLAVERSHVRDIHTHNIINNFSQFANASGAAFVAPTGGRIIVGEIPHRPKNFIDRGEYRQLHDVVKTSRVVIVTGMRGVGKSQLAGALVRWAVDHGDGLVAWINAETIEIARSELATLAQRLGIVDSNEDSTVAALRLRDYFSADCQSALLVFDNATDPDRIRSLLPCGGAAEIVITTTDRSFLSLGQLVDLRGFTEDEAIGYLCDATELSDRAGAVSVAEALGFLPLALSMAAATIRGRRLRFDQYESLLNSKPLPTLLARKAGHDYPRSVVQSILLSVDAVERATDNSELDEATVVLIGLMSVLSPAGVRRELLPVLHGRLDEAIERCVSGSLLTWSDAGDTVLMHRLVARVVRERARSGGDSDSLIYYAIETFERWMSSFGNKWDGREILLHVVDQLDAVGVSALLESVSTEDVDLVLIARSWAVDELRRFADIARSRSLGEATVADCERVLGLEHPTTQFAHNALAATYLTAGEFDKGIGLIEGLVADSERALGLDHPDTLTFRNNLGYAYDAAGRLDKAIAVHESTMAALERVLGRDHPDTLNSRNNLADTYREVGRLASAITLLEPALECSERVLGTGHSATLTLRNNLAGVYTATAQFERAITLYEVNLADRVRALGADHPDVLASRHNLAHGYSAAGRFGDALVLYESTLVDFERILGFDHPDTITARGNLAAAHGDAGRFDKAVTLFEAVLADRERLLGSNHPDIVVSRNNLAVGYKDAGQYGKALAMQEAVVIDCEILFGPDHPETLRARNNLAGAWSAVGQFDKAAALCEAVLVDFERLMGGDHPLTLGCRANLATNYEGSGLHGKAANLLEVALADHERVLGIGHPDTLHCLINLAAIYESQGQIDKAVVLSEGALDDCERTLGFDHPHTLHCRNNLAYMYGKVGQYERAVANYRITLAARQNVLGPDHPDTLISRNNLACALVSAGKFQESLASHVANLGDFERVLGQDDPMADSARECIVWLTSLLQRGQL